MKYQTGISLLVAARNFHGYDDEGKAALKRSCVKFAKDLAKAIGVSPSKARTNEAGVAVAADVYLHDPEKGVYVFCTPSDSFLSSYQIMWRGCTPQDVYGTGMRHINQWEAVPQTQEAFDTLVQAIRDTAERARTPLFTAVP